MKNTAHMLRHAYTAAREVFEDKLSRTDAIDRLMREDGFNQSTAGDVIDNVLHMLNGREYKRKNSATAVRIFLRRIYTDYGPQRLANALHAVRQHIDYYAAIPKGSPQPGQEAILRRFHTILDSPLVWRAEDGLTEEQQQETTDLRAELERNGEFNPHDSTDARKRVMTAIVIRQGQGAFRAALLRRYRKCLVTGCRLEAVLEAAHIVPYRGDHTDAPSNGLLLRSDVHTLFDLGLLGVNPDGMTVLISDRLRSTRYARFDGKALLLPSGDGLRPDADALTFHRERWRL